MLQLRVYGEQDSMAAVAKELERLAGTRHLTVARTGVDGGASVSADVRAETADQALSVLERLGVPADDVVLVRVDEIGSPPDSPDSLALVWADVLGQARARARLPGRYFVLMAAAGVVAAFAIINHSAVLIVGAMAISPDLLPITAACTGIALLRRRLALRGLGALLVGLATTGAVALTLTALLDVLGLMPGDFELGSIPAAQTHVNTSTILIALAAGVAGMLATEARGSAAVGVAISVTTIPAVAYLGVGIAIGEAGKSLSALGVLGVNIGMMLAGGSTTLALQRVLARRRALAVMQTR
jgi:uncharacterized hydrophobic protein (TIGR00271 family)